ncbi:E3 ubiquitin-protein ligase UBR2, partial [Dissostichus eleginoides]
VCLGPRRSGAAQRRQLVTCILCQEEQEVRGQGRAMVLAAFVQRSTVLSKNRRRSLPEPVHYDPLFMHPDLSLGTHNASCGHIMHADCWQRYFEAVQVKEQRRQQRLRGHTSYDVEHGEFLCPLVDHPSLETWLKTTNQQIAALCSAHRKQSGVEGAEPEVPEGFRVDFTPQNPFSSSISEMITTFSMSIYKVSLKLNPNEQDPRVPVLSWATCAYTIQSIERLLMDEDKPLFGSLPCRQVQFLLLDCSSSNNGSHTLHQAVHRLFTALVPDSQVEDSLCVLDIDMFHLLVYSVMSYSSIHCLDQSEHRTVDSAHLHLLHLVTVAHLVQILLTSITEEVCMDQDSEGSEEEELTCQLYNTLRKHLGRWCVHPGVRQALQGGGGMVRFPRESNQLIELPEDYSTLINQASSFL